MDLLLDDDVAELLGSKSIHMSGGYPAVMLFGKSTRIHNIVVGVPLCGWHTDHINRNKMDNRRENLRTVPPWVNYQNYGAHRDARSQHRGVSWSDHNGGWIAQSMINGKRKHLGTFQSEDEAARVVREYRDHLGGH